MQINKIKIINYHKNEEGWDYIIQNRVFLWNFLNDGYKFAGYDSFKGCYDKRSLIKNANLIKIAYYGEIVIAISVYTGYLDGYKCVGITATTDPELREIGKIAVKKIIQTDIGLYKEFYWCECSGSVENMFKKYDGIAIPNAYAESILNNNIESLDDDGFHYDRKIGDDIETKIIYGFNNKETYDKVRSEQEKYILDCERKLKERYGISESSQELNKIQYAKGVVDIFIRMRYEWGTYEFTKESMNKLKKNLDIVNNAIDAGTIPDSMIHSFSRTSEYGKDVLDSSTYLELH